MEPRRPLRFVTAASLFDGHDAAITIMRRILQTQGAEVIHLGHDRSVEDVVRAVLQESADAVAISSYQGGHLEYFGYLVDRLRAEGARHVHVFGGGGGVIVPEEIAQLADLGARIYSPDDGRRLGLVGMIDDMMARTLAGPRPPLPAADAVLTGEDRALGSILRALAADALPAPLRDCLRDAARQRDAPVLGITGTGGSGKSSLTDELIRRLRDGGKTRIAVLAVDPSRSRSGGALLGDRIRVNCAGEDGVFFHSLSAPAGHAGLPAHLDDMIAACRSAGYDLVIVETPGIGQGDRAIVNHADVSLYVMTPEFGAASQLEKIDMLDFADAIAINKFERRGAQDAWRDVCRQVWRNRGDFTASWQDMPVFGTSAARFADEGVTALADFLRGKCRGVTPQVPGRAPSRPALLVPAARERHLAEAAETVRRYHEDTARYAEIAGRAQSLDTAAAELPRETAAGLRERAATLREQLPAELVADLASWADRRAAARADETAWRESPSGSRVPRRGLPRTSSHADLVTFLRSENLPGSFPYSAGVFPHRRDAEEPTRMFAGEGDPPRTNRRFHALASGQPATRLSVAFDSVTLYGRDPSTRPDVYGKVGTSGVSVATLDDMKALFAGFDLCDPATSVSMTINGPAPAILAMFFVTAIDQRRAARESELGRSLTDAERAETERETLRTLRGTVQADILKEDQGQNTCIFTTDFSLRCMADVQQWFISHDVRQFYSVSISGYHIAEAGANPITQLAFTLANALTYVEAYRARGMAVDDFAPSLSFFFSNGMDVEYTVIGRVARRIWAIVMRDLYGASERSQRLKYHIQTSGRSLHAQEMTFNDIRTTLQALCAHYDNCNSLHTNAYDEAVTTPTDESVRRALAIQMIVNREWGLGALDNPLQGSFLVEELTDLVEREVLAEFDRLADRGGVLGAMETGYQRGRIQDESMEYERRKHDGTLPIIGVNTFVAEEPPAAPSLPLSRATEEERRAQVDRLQGFHERHREEAPAALDRLRAAAADGNVFDALMDAVRSCSLGQITDAFFEVGGQYRRSL